MSHQHHLLKFNQQHSLLKSANLKSTTLQSYNNKLLLFLSFYNLSLSRLSRYSRSHLDHLFSSWLDAYHSSGGHYTYACWSFHGLLYHYPSLSHHLPLSAQRLDGWKKIQQSISISHPPLTWELTCVIAVLLASWGDFAASCCVLLGFHCH